MFLMSVLRIFKYKIKIVLIPGVYHFILWMLIVFGAKGFTYEML